MRDVSQRLLNFYLLLYFWEVLMQFVVVLDIPDSQISDQDIDLACSVVNRILNPEHSAGQGIENMSVRPLSEVISC